MGSIIDHGRAALSLLVPRRLAGVLIGAILMELRAPREGETMASVHDVAAYILKNRGPMSAMKLQKLAYYSQAWSLVWDERPLFAERIEAWANGPVAPALYDKHRGSFNVQAWPYGNPDALDGAAQATVNIVLAGYGDKDPQWLSDLSHLEAPWKNARRSLAPGERCSEEITPAALAEYYGSLPPEAASV
jgi:uncharacterized phage-associated protein